MTTTAIREKLYSYIKEVDDDKIRNIYSLFEDQISPAADWSENEGFVAELNERVRRLEEGIDKGVTLTQVKSSLKRLKEERSNRSQK